MSDTGTPREGSDKGEPDQDRPSGNSLPAYSPQSPADPPRGHGRTALILAVVALIVSLIVAAAVFVLWRSDARAVSQAQAGLQSLDSRVGDLDRQIGDLGGQLDDLEGRLAQLEGLADTQARQAQRMGEIEDSIESVTQTLERMRETVVHLANVFEAGRLGWTLTGAERLLEVANARLQLVRDVEGALTALRIVKQRLGQLDDPRLFAVRQAVQRGITALEAVPVPDTQGLALTLASMVETVPRLPLQRDVPGGFLPEAIEGGAADEAPWWRRAAYNVWAALRSLVDVRRTDEAAPALLAPSHEYFLYRNLQLKLQAARLSLLQHDNAGFHVAVATARDWLETYFVVDAPAVSAMTRSLEEMADVDLTPPLPEIARPLTLLRERMRTLGDVPPPAAAPAPQAPESQDRSAPVQPQREQAPPDQPAPAQQGRPSQERPTQDRPPQDQPSQGEPSQGQPPQNQPSQGQPSQGQSSQGQPSQDQSSQGQPPQDQPAQDQPAQGQSLQKPPPGGSSSPAQPPQARSPREESAQ